MAVKVRANEVDRDNRLKLTSLLTWFQEAASLHADGLGVGYVGMRDLGLGWFLSEYVIHVRDFPRYADEIEVVTWPNLKKGIRAYRAFTVQAKGAEPGAVAAAQSIWLAVDLASGRPRKIEGALPHFEDRPGEVVRVSDQAWDDPGPDDESRDFPVLSEDIDLNGHVNNAVWLRYALEPARSTFKKARVAKCLQMKFLGTAAERDRVTSRIHVTGDDTETVTQHVVFGPLGDKPLFRMRATWIPADEP